MPRLAMASILNAKRYNALVLIAVVCSSFVAVNAGTHKRSPLNPEGDVSLPSVQLGNELVCRNFGIGLECFGVSCLYTVYHTGFWSYRSLYGN